MKFWIAMSALVLFGAWVAFFYKQPAQKVRTSPIASTKPAPRVNPNPEATPGPKQPELTPEQLAQEAQRFDLPQPPPISATEDDARAYVDELAKIAVGTHDPQKTEAIRRIRRDFEHTRRRAIADERKAKEEARRKEDIEARKKEREERRPPPPPPRDPSKPKDPAVELPPPLEGVKEPEKKP